MVLVSVVAGVHTDCIVYTCWLASTIVTCSTGRKHRLQNTNDNAVTLSVTFRLYCNMRYVTRSSIT